MKVYFVRHGETSSNLQESGGNFNDQLTEVGREQAQKLAHRIFDIPIDIIFASPYKRTEETAGIIAKEINKEIKVVSLLGEKKWPSEIKGKSLKDPEVERIFDLLREKNNLDPTWHYSNEENFFDIKKRAGLFIEYVSESAYINILAVSHQYFIRMVIASILYGDQLSYEVFRNFFHSTPLNNASLTLCEKKQDTWKLITLNDQQYLKK